MPKIEQNEVLRMAREAGFYGLPVDERLEHFAALVATYEREACAKVCEEFGRTVNVETWDMAGKDCAAAIRARGKA